MSVISKDYSIAPIAITITNISSSQTIKETPIASDPNVVQVDPGSNKPGAQPESEVIRDTLVPALSFELQTFINNLFVDLEPGDSIKFYVKDSNELMYWFNIEAKYPNLIKVESSDYVRVYPTPTYNEVTATPDSYDVVTPEEGDNPYEQGWYIRTGTGTDEDPYEYTICPDTETTVDAEKTYCSFTAGDNPYNEGWYVRTGEGTDEDPYVYTKCVSSETSVDTSKVYCSVSYDQNPKELGWYEFTDNKYVKTEDSSVNIDKEYYVYITED